MVDLKDFSTMKLGGKTRFFAVAKNTDDVLEAIRFAKEKNISMHVLGGGSNTVFRDEAFPGLTLKIEIEGITKKQIDETNVLVSSGAGVAWDELVAYSVENGLSGIEALSSIPGSVGGTPVQNVGAYGQEVGDTIESVEVVDIVSGEIKILSNKDCAFSYRDSIFKNEARGRYIITEVVFKLSTLPPKTPHYPGVKEYFDKKGIETPTLFDICSAITEIRKNKLPDPREIASCGSFFKNPFVSEATYLKIKERYPGLKYFEMEDGTYKIPAGWILETLGYKGKIIGNFEFYSHNALVLVNKGGGDKEELEGLVKDVQEKVQKEFSILIEPEPVFM
jgi:UDP-N-acetylmuramate dehydrogenase